MKYGSLFSGVGGFDLAAQWMGGDNLFHCEWNPFGQKVLKYYWPNAVSYGDITKTDFNVWRGQIDILTGGFPCQGFSLAGARKGTEDDRYLWPEMRRAYNEIRPRVIVGENVTGILSMEDKSGNAREIFPKVESRNIIRYREIDHYEAVYTRQAEMLVSNICKDLEKDGYETQTFAIPAAGVGAPHRRERIFFLAYRSDAGAESLQQRENGTDGLKAITNSRSQQLQERPQERNQQDKEKEGAGVDNRAERSGDIGDVANSNSIKRPEGRMHEKGPEKAEGHVSSRNACSHERGTWDQFPTQSPVRQRNDGFSYRLVRYLTNELKNEISKTSKENRIKDLSKVWENISQKEVWEKIRGLYSLESKDVLFQTMQLYSKPYIGEVQLSPFSEKFSGKILQKLRKYGEFTSTPQGQELEKQRSKKSGNSLWFLPHEIALASRAFETAIAKFETWHRQESIKAYGNSVVPQVVYEIFKAIEQYETGANQ